MAAPNKSAAALVLLAAMIAGLAPLLQAGSQLDAWAVDSFFNKVDKVCSDDSEMKTCARQLVASEGATIPLNCCGDFLEAVTSGAEGTRCACGFGVAAADNLGVDVDQSCHAASNGGLAGRAPLLLEFCMMEGPRRQMEEGPAPVPAPAPAPAPPAVPGN